MVWCGLFTVNSPKLSSFHLQGPRVVVLSLSPLKVSDPQLANRLDSQLILLHWSVISQCRPRLPSVSTGLLSMDMLPIVTADSSTSSSHHSSSLELPIRGGFFWNFVRLTFSLARDVTLGSCNWQLLTAHTQLLTHRTGREVHRSTSFSTGSVPRDPRTAKSQTVHPNNQRKKALHRLLRCLRGLIALQRTRNQWSPTARFAMFLGLLPHNSQPLFLWVQILGGPPFR